MFLATALPIVLFALYMLVLLGGGALLPDEY